MILFTKYSTDHNEILLQSTANFDRISNSIEMPLAGRAPAMERLELYDVIYKKNQLNASNLYEK